MSLVTKKIAGGWWFVRERKVVFGPTSRSTLVDSLKLSEDIGRYISDISTRPVHTSGGFGDVHIGKHRKIGKVALKRPRNTSDLDEAVIDRFLREAETWRGLVHPHVLPFVGIGRVAGEIYIVSPYIDNGTLAEYIKTHPDADRPRLLCETCDAVTFLHRSSVVHGDIKANNILLSKDVHALLCDFGLAKTAQSITSSAMKGAGNARWQAPEIWDNASRSYKSDVYSFGMTIIEVLLGKPPFAELNDAAVIKAVIDLKRPPRPAFPPPMSTFYDYLWDVAEMCCSRNAVDRLDMGVCLPLLKQLSPRRVQLATETTEGLVPAAILRAKLEMGPLGFPDSGEQTANALTSSLESGDMSDNLDSPFSSKLSSELAHLAADLAIFPEAGRAIQTLEMIYVSAVMVTYNQAKCRNLANQAKNTFHLIKNHMHVVDRVKLRAIVETMEGHLKRIHRDLLLWSEYKLWKAWLNRDEILKAIRAYREAFERVTSDIATAVSYIERQAEQGNAGALYTPRSQLWWNTSGSTGEYYPIASDTFNEKFYMPRFSDQPMEGDKWPHPNSHRFTDATSGCELENVTQRMLGEAFSPSGFDLSGKFPTPPRGFDDYDTESWGHGSHWSGGREQSFSNPMSIASRPPSIADSLGSFRPPSQAANSYHANNSLNSRGSNPYLRGSDHSRSLTSISQLGPSSSMNEMAIHPPAVQGRGFNIDIPSPACGFVADSDYRTGSGTIPTTKSPMGSPLGRGSIRGSGPGLPTDSGMSHPNTFSSEPSSPAGDEVYRPFWMFSSDLLYGGPSPDEHPGDEELRAFLLHYLSTIDLNTVTKKTARATMDKKFPRANLASRKDFINRSIDEILYL